MGIKEIMDINENKAIALFGKRSFTVVYLITIFFAILGGWAIIYTDSKILWAAWIPFCFLVIPLMHHLAKKVLELEARISKLESK